jgi:hypothetical protein
LEKLDEPLKPEEPDELGFGGGDEPELDASLLELMLGFR